MSITWICKKYSGEEIREHDLLAKGFEKPFKVVLSFLREVKEFRVLVDGAIFQVDLSDGSFLCMGEKFTPERIDAPLRLIYYKRRGMTLGYQIETIFVCIGWQATVEGKNIRMGVKIYPKEKRYEITEDI